MNLLTAKEVATQLGLSVQTLAIWRCKHPGRLPYIKLTNRAVRYEASAVQAFIDARRGGGRLD